jgi:hypothetical protein
VLLLFLLPSRPGLLHPGLSPWLLKDVTLDKFLYLSHALFPCLKNVDIETVSHLLRLISV